MIAAEKIRFLYMFNWKGSGEGNLVRFMAFLGTLLETRSEKCIFESNFDRKNAYFCSNLDRKMHFQSLILAGKRFLDQIFFCKIFAKTHSDTFDVFYEVFFAFRPLQKISPLNLLLDAKKSSRAVY